MLARQQQESIDLPIEVGVEQRVPCRLLAQRVPPAVAAERRRRLRAEARRKGKMVSAARLALADWTIYITNVPPTLLTLAEGLVVGCLRWQIELLFKLWKDEGRVDESRSEKPWRILCEVYAKLLAMLVQHWILLVSCCRYVDRSLHKAAKTVRRHALSLAIALAEGSGLDKVLKTIARCLAWGCRINKRKTAPHTYQLLLELGSSP